MTHCTICKHPLIEHGDYPEEECDCCSGRGWKNKTITPEEPEDANIWFKEVPDFTKSGRRDGRIPPKFRVIPGYPDYMINRQGTVKHIATDRFCLFMRLSESGGALISIRKNGTSKVVAVQELLSRAFGGKNAKSP